MPRNTTRPMLIIRGDDNPSGWIDQRGTEWERIDLSEWPVTPDEALNVDCAWCPGWFRNVGWFNPATGEHVCGRHMRFAPLPDGSYPG